MSHHISQLQAELDGVRKDLDRETSARRLREKYACHVQRILRDKELDENRKLLEGMREGFSIGVQTHVSEIWAYTSARGDQV